MKGFEDVKISWRGEEYVVPADGQLMLICKIEDALAGPSGDGAIVALTREGGPSHARLAAAFGAALRHAGAAVTDDEIYLSIMQDFADGKADVAVKIQGAVVALLSIIAPPIAAALRDDVDEKKPQEATAEE